jgi:pimeloyl-ACP methyl ester carboxylesterase
VDVVTVGPLPAASPCYVERRADRLVTQLVRRMDYVQIVDPRQQGKSSLLVRLPGVLPDYRVAYVDTESLDDRTEAHWYRDLTGRLRGQLAQLPALAGQPLPEDAAGWRAFLGAVVASAGEGGHVLIVLDEVGSIRQPWAEMFFRVLRELYTVRAFETVFQRLTFVLAGTFDPNALIRDPAISPFNIAQPVHLEDFSLAELSILAERMGLGPHCAAAAAELFAWTDGQPYLAHNLCLYLRAQAGDPRECFGEAIRWVLEADTQHLTAMRRHLHKDPALAVYARKALAGRMPMTPAVNPLQFRLAFVVGLLKRDPEGRCRIRNRIYESVLPDLLPEGGEPAAVPAPAEAARPSTARLVLSLHGIRTRGAWQKALNDDLQAAGFVHKQLDYGNFLALQLLLPGSRRRKVEWLLAEYTALRDKWGKDVRPHVIAHSFGTYLVARALELYPEIQFDQVILCGGIVRPDFPWTTVMGLRKQAGRVLNHYGRRDLWARLVGWAVEDAGPSGWSGFRDLADGGVVQRCHTEFRHSDFFYSLNFRQVWVPVLRGEAVPPAESLVPRGANWRFRLVVAVALSLAGAALVWFLR